jgi:hypothetical protein
LTFNPSETQSYVRGTSDSFVKKYGNLHGHLAPLRHAVYKWTGRTSAVEELYPEWDKSVGDVTWVKVSAVPSDEGLPEEVRSVRAQGPVELGRAALRWLEARDPATADPVDASNMERGFARAILVAELMCCIDGEQELLEMLTSVTGHSVCESSARAAWPPREYMVKTHNVGRTGRGGSGRARGQVSLSALPSAVESTCVAGGCGRTFTVTPGEVHWFASRGFALPKRCKPCRNARRTGA